MNSPAAFHDRARLLQSIHFTRDYYFLGRIQDFTKGGFEFLCKFEWNVEHFSGNLSEKDALTDKKIQNT